MESYPERSFFSDANSTMRLTYGKVEGSKPRDGMSYDWFTTIDGITNIVIPSGSEKIWLNGKLLSRGEDLDYTIDYSKGEVYFTSKNLIYFDSDIDFEYLYRQTDYTTSYLETGIEGSLFNESDFQLKYIRENQNINLLKDVKVFFKTKKEKIIYYTSLILFLNIPFLCC